MWLLSFTLKLLVIEWYLNDYYQPCRQLSVIAEEIFIYELMHNQNWYRYNLTMIHDGRWQANNS